MRYSYRELLCIQHYRLIMTYVSSMLHLIYIYIYMYITNHMFLFLLFSTQYHFLKVLCTHLSCLSAHIVYAIRNKAPTLVIGDVHLRSGVVRFAEFRPEILKQKKGRDVETEAAHISGIIRSICRLHRLILHNEKLREECFAKACASCVHSRQ